MNLINPHNTASYNKPNHGFSLIEMMVALVIGLVVSLAIYGVLNVSEGRKRTTNSVNEIDQAGSYAMYQIDKAIRSAGSGFSAGITPIAASTAVRASTYAYGCPLRVARNGVPLIPASSFPSPFGAIVGSNLVMAPIIIVDGAAGAAGDVLITMAGSSGLGESGTRFADTPSGANLNLINQAAMSASVTQNGTAVADKLLLAAAPAAAMSTCLMSQIAAGFTPAAGGAIVPLGGEFYSANVAGTTVVSYKVEAPNNSIVLNLGKSPIFTMLGVGVNNRLFSYDLLSPANENGVNTTTAPNPSLFVDGVYQMEAVYGVNAAGNPDTVALNWVAPTGAFSAANLMAGTPAANTNLNRIAAVRVALVLITSLPEKTDVSAASATIFNDIGLPQTVSLSPLNRRFRVLESTIILRNTMMPR